MVFKEIINDYKEENFTKKDWLVYGLVIPFFLAALTLFGSWLGMFIK